jgi:hypothetical protein
LALPGPNSRHPPIDLTAASKPYRVQEKSSRAQQEMGLTSD